MTFLFVFRSTIREFKSRYSGQNFQELKNALGENFPKWFELIKRIYKVAYLLSKGINVSLEPNKKRDKLYARMFSLFSCFKSKQIDWDINTFVWVLKKVHEKLPLQLMSIMQQIFFKSFRKYVDDKIRPSFVEREVDHSERVKLFHTMRVYDAFFRIVKRYKTYQWRWDPQELSAKI
jgi:hypothetical protein